MRRIFVILATVLGLIVSACGADSVTTGGELLPTPVPAPTVAGRIVELEAPEVQAETVLIGVSSSESVGLHARPGLDQPLAGEVPAGMSIEPLGQAFETDDGLIWWQVRAGTMQGWIQPNVAYRGPAEDITAQVVSTVGTQVTYDSAEEAATAIAEKIGADLGATDVIVVSTIEKADPPSASVTVDLLGLEDDSLLGYRLIIASASATGWFPESVIQANLCARGVSPEGLCL